MPKPTQRPRNTGRTPAPRRRERATPFASGEPVRGRALRTRLAFGTAVLAALVIAGFGIERSGLLDVRDVKVEGAQTLNARVLAERSGLRGQYLLTADLGAAERRLESLPMVAGAKVERAWPLGVRIRISERRGWAVWERGGRRYVVDGDGRVLDGMEAPPGSPVVVDAREGDVAVGGSAVADIAGAAHVLRERMPAVVGLKAESFRFEDKRGLIVVSTDGHVAIFGDGRDLDYKLAVWKALLNAPDSEIVPLAWVEVVDLRFGDRPSLVNAIERPSEGDRLAKPSPSAAAREERPVGARIEAAPSPAPRMQGLAAGDAAISRSR